MTQALADHAYEIAVTMWETSQLPGTSRPKREDFEHLIGAPDTAPPPTTPAASLGQAGQPVELDPVAKKILTSMREDQLHAHGGASTGTA